jgi:DNA-binding response OmpR family regulator
MTTETTKDNGEKKKVLIVDDEPDVSNVLKKVFDQSGFNADSYDDPILALENFKAGSYDLVLLDIKMPEMDGFRLCQEMRKIDSKVKVCFLTASEMYYERFRKQEGLFALDKEIFVRKPIGNEDLIKKINTIISQPGS